MIEIREPRVEALIYERLQTGNFQAVNEVLLQALSDAPLPSKRSIPVRSGLTGADVIDAFQRSPFQETDLEPAHTAMKVSDPVRF